MANAQKMSITLAPSAAAEIAARRARGGNNSGVISATIDRYAAVLAEARRTLRDKLRVAEVSACLDALNGYLTIEPRTVALVSAEIRDAILGDDLGPKWGIDPDTLIATLDGLTFAEQMSLVDAAERWWMRVGAGENPEPREALR